MVRIDHGSELELRKQQALLIASIEDQFVGKTKVKDLTLPYIWVSCRTTLFERHFRSQSSEETYNVSHYKERECINILL